MWTHKYGGVELSHSIAEALAIDRKIRNTFWWVADGIAKGMEKLLSLTPRILNPKRLISRSQPI